MARQENTREPMNEVYLRGRISHIYGNERFGSLTVPYSEIVTRRVRQDGQTRFEQSVETYFPEAMFNSNTKTKGIIQSFRVGDHVLIKGYIGAYSYQSGAGYTERTVIYIDEIEHDTTRMEQMLGVAGFSGRYVDAANEIRLEAKISGVTKRRDDIYEIRLEARKDGRAYNVSGMYFRAPQGLDQKIHLGDTVYVIGAMESSRTEYRGKVYFAQTFIIQELTTQHDFIEKYNAAAQAAQAAEQAESKPAGTTRRRRNAAAAEATAAEQPAEAVTETEEAAEAIGADELPESAVIDDAVENAGADAYGDADASQAGDADEAYEAGAEAEAYADADAADSEGGSYDGVSDEDDAYEDIPFVEETEDAGEEEPRA